MKQEIKILLDKYYSADCSEEEEKLLRELLSDEESAGEFILEKEIFESYRLINSNIPSSSDNFEEKVMSEIDKLEQSAGTNSLQKFWFYLSGIAAGVALLAVLYFVDVSRKEPKDSFSDPAVAYAETMKVLYEVSAKLNKGIKTVEPLGELQSVTQKSLSIISEPALIAEKKLQELKQLQQAVELLQKNNLNPLNQ